MNARQTDWRQLLHAALLKDLARMAAVARHLPMGGLPQANDLAKHSYLVCATFEHHLDYLRRLHAEGVAERGAGDLEPDAGTDEMVQALKDVERRLKRLYTADRPGGLDHLDFHLSRLHQTAKEQFLSIQARSDRSASRDPTGTAPEPPWWAGLSNRQRAGILAWVLTASDTPSRLLVGSQPLLTRWFLRIWYRRRAVMRASRLGLVP